MHTTHVISLPANVSGTPGTLNCVNIAPLLGPVKRFRKLSRKTVEINNEFNATVDRLASASTAFAEATPGTDEAAALQKTVDEVQSQLDALDEKTYAAITEQVKACYRVASFTPVDGTEWTGDLPNFGTVDWDNVDVTDLREAVNFFSKLTNS